MGKKTPKPKPNQQATQQKNPSLNFHSKHYSKGILFLYGILNRNTKNIPQKVIKVH